MTRVAAAVLAATMLAALCGCTAITAAKPSGVPEPTPSADATDTPQPEPIVAKPAPALGGDCEAIAGVEELSALVGDELVPGPVSPDSDWVWPVEVLGGLDCVWTSDSDALVALDVVPISSLPAEAAGATAESPYCFGGDVPDRRCTFDALIGGYWVSGVVGLAADAPGSAPEVFDEISARVAQVAQTAPPVPVTRPDGAWNSPTDCAATQDAVDTTTILGEPFLASEGSRGGEVTRGLAAAWAAPGSVSCAWQDADGTGWFSTGSLAGAGWAIPALADVEGSDPVPVDGAVEAFAITKAGFDATTVYATDGVNAAWVTAPPDLERSRLLSLAASILAAGRA